MFMMKTRLPGREKNRSKVHGAEETLACSKNGKRASATRVAAMRQKQNKMRSEEYPDHRGFAKIFGFHSSAMESRWSI